MSRAGLRAAINNIECVNIECSLKWYIRYSPFNNSILIVFLIKIIAMPSFDFSSKVDLQTLDNAINTVSKEITNRFDFKGSPVVIELNKKEFKVGLEAESE